MSLEPDAPALKQVQFNHWTSHLKFRSLSWWIWLSLTLTIAADISGFNAGNNLTNLIAIGQAVAWIVHYRSVTRFSCQVRIVFVIWIALSSIPTLGILSWSLLAGLLLSTFFGYCPIARMLVFLPFNRQNPLTFAKAGQILFHPPVATSLSEALDL